MTQATLNKLRTHPDFTTEIISKTTIKYTPINPITHLKINKKQYSDNTHNPIQYLTLTTDHVLQKYILRVYTDKQTQTTLIIEPDTLNDITLDYTLTPQ